MAIRTHLERTQVDGISTVVDLHGVFSGLSRGVLTVPEDGRGLLELARDIATIYVKERVCKSMHGKVYCFSIAMQIHERS